MNNKEIRKTALSRLNYYWVEAVFMYLILFCAISALELILSLCLQLYIPGFPSPEDAETDMRTLISFMFDHGEAMIALAVFAVVTYITVTPMYYGIKWCFYLAAQWKPAPVSGAFYIYFSARRWFKALALNLLLVLKKVVYMLPCAAVCITAFYAADNLKRGREGAVPIILNIGLLIIFTGSLMIYMAMTVKYDLVIYFYTEQPDGSLLTAYHKGVAAVKGSRWRFGALKIWFLPLLVISTAGFPSMLVIPFYWMVKSIGAVQIIKGNFNDVPPPSPNETQTRTADPIPEQSTVI